MGKVFQRKERNQKDWYITYVNRNGRRIKKRVGPSKKLAEAVLSKIELSIVENKYLDVDKKVRIEFEDFSKEYLELHSKVNNKSWKKSDLRNLTMLNCYFRGKSLDEITPYLIEKFKSQRIAQVSPARVNRNLATLKSMFNRAKAWHKFSGENPVTKVKMFKENNERTRFLEQEEITILLSNCSERFRPIVIFALNTGTRLGEILGLRWQDVDSKRGFIYLYNTKNGEKREVPINDNVKKVLIEIKKHPKSDFVFCNPDGTQRKDIRFSFFTALKKSGINEFRFHDLRHTFASHLVMAGVDINTVRELLGHKTIKMTLRYSHLSPLHKKRAVDILGEKIVPPQSPSLFSENRDLVEVSIS